MFDYIKTLTTVALNDRKGITALEYGVLAAAVIAGVAVAATTLSTSITGKMSDVASSV
jgi:Flp pilus assembly pilin Flp